jgi:hypothetical protein
MSVSDIARVAVKAKAETEYARGVEYGRTQERETQMQVARRLAIDRLVSSPLHHRDLDHLIEDADKLVRWLLTPAASIGDNK